MGLLGFDYSIQVAEVNGSAVVAMIQVVPDISQGAVFKVWFSWMYIRLA